MTNDRFGDGDAPEGISMDPGERQLRGIHCPQCREFVLEEGARTFLGFRKVQCGECGRKTLLPLGTGYRIATWVSLTFILAWSAVVWPPNGLGFYVLIAAALSFALWKDRVARGRAISEELHGADPSPKDPTR